MKEIFRRASLMTAIAAAVTGLALPASAARAAEPLPCPHFHSVCAWSQPDGQGSLRLLRHDERILFPPVRSARNRTSEAWCLYDRPGFRGDQRRELRPHQAIHHLGFPALSARRGYCRY